MKKKFLLMAIPFMALVSCGGNEENEDESTEVSEEMTEEDVVIDESVLIAEMDEEYIPDNTDGKWEIDDYAEIMMAGKIYPATDQIPEEETAYAHYYRKLDLSGGYAEVTGAYEGWSEIVMWRMKDGNDLIGCMSAGCGPLCDYSFKFSIFKQGEMVQKDASDQVLPIDEILEQNDKIFKKIVDSNPNITDDSYGQIIYNLPQKGTSMMVDLSIEEEEFKTHLLNLTWDKEKFTVSETYDDLENIMYQ